MSDQYVKQFNADQGELSLMSGGSHWKRYGSSKISSIQSKKDKKKVLFFEKPIERIEIHISGEEKPYIIEKGKIKDDFQWIKDVLKRFAEKNKVNFVDEQQSV